MVAFAELMARYDGMMDGDGSGWGWGVLMMVLVLLAVVVVVWLVVRSTQSTAAAGPPADANFRARELLGERLAKGEIGPEEYQERISQLR